MVTAGEIQSIDYTGNSCSVRLPFFETTNSVEAFIADAKIAIAPGICNGYQKGDMVWVAFADNYEDRPVVIGKVFTSARTEQAGSGSAVISSELEVKNTAKLPLTTNISGADNNYNSFAKIINSLKSISQEIRKTETDIFKTYAIVVGQWIDGSSVYKQSFVAENISADTSVDVGTIDGTVKDVIQVSHVLKNKLYEDSSDNADSDSGDEGQYCFSTNIGGYVVVASSGKIKFISTLDIKKLIVTVYYTKVEK